MTISKHNSTQVIYQLPDLHKKWPFPRTINVWHQDVSPVSADWVESFGLFSEAHKRRFRKFNCGLLASLAYPYHTKEELRPAADLMNVLFAMDDISDELTIDGIRNLSDICLDALRSVILGYILLYSNALNKVVLAIQTSLVLKVNTQLGSCTKSLILILLSSTEN